ncbi:MAG TPA: hypothetical protein VFX58_04185 [Chitinophagaceae bacterium]|nr:hypothetical protein [Chitinophagaceae bacterium]
MKVLLSSKATHYALLGLNIVVIFVMFFVSAQAEFPDANSYWHMARGFRHGVFSSWYFLPVYTPETLRTWGYPVFVYLCQLIYDAPITVKLVQLILHFITLWLCLRLIFHFRKELLSRNLFLLLMLPNVQLPYYAGQVAAETTSIFCITLFIFIWYTHTDSIRKMLYLALIAFIGFQIRPVFMLIPFLLVAYKLFFERRKLGYYLGFLFLFSILLVPFGLWNKKAHGIFKITPLEGGVGAANLGFWSFRLPDGYHPKFYWDSHFKSDFTQPSFVQDEERVAAQQQYEQEWMEINKELEKYITAEDSVRLAVYKEKKYKLWEVMSSGYTHARENLLKQYLVRDIKAHPWYYFKTRIYTAARVWFTGINKSDFENASVSGKVRLLYPFLVTFTFIFCGLLFLLFSLFRGWLAWRIYWPIFLFILYYGMAHLPFGVQARYTVPVHIFILMLLSIVIGQLLNKPKSVAQASL